MGSTKRPGRNVLAATKVAGVSGMLTEQSLRPRHIDEIELLRSYAFDKQRKISSN